MRGMTIGYYKKVSVNGGSVVMLCDAPNGRGASWVDDTIVFLPVSTGGDRISAAISCRCRQLVDKNVDK